MKQAQQLHLFSTQPAIPRARVVRVRPARPRLQRTRRMPLWLAVHLPRLAIEALHRDDPLQPHAAIEASRGTMRIASMNEAAAASGIEAGMTLAGGWALLPQLEVHEREPAKERECLYRLALRAQRFTPLSTLDEQAVLLEVRGSLALFGGAEALMARAAEMFTQARFTFSLALAPTPRAALWLARAQRRVHVDAPDELPGALGELPLAATGFAPDVLEHLHGLGARRLQDVMRLPRDGIGRRYGARIVRELDQALGRLPDVRLPVPLPKRFSTRLDVVHEISLTANLLPPLGRLLDELEDYLAVTQQGVRRMVIDLVHRDRSITPVAIGFANATRDGRRMRQLVEQRLESVALPAPVLEIGLKVTEMTLLAGADRSLFQEGRGDDRWPEIVETLRMRLGDDAVASVAHVEDYRPERAWRFVAPGQAQDTAGLPNRPCWLLTPPQPLTERRGQPFLDGPLRIIDGPERIETGWWDEADVSRDYFSALDANHRRLWICREVKTGRWWWQGVFA